MAVCVVLTGCWPTAELLCSSIYHAPKLYSTRIHSSRRDSIVALEYMHVYTHVLYVGSGRQVRVESGSYRWVEGRVKLTKTSSLSWVSGEASPSMDLSTPT